MSRSTKFVAVGVATAGFALASVALAVAVTSGGSHMTLAGPAMMAGYGQGMMRGAGMMNGGVYYAPSGQAGSGRRQPSAGDLAAVRDRVQSWLASNGFSGFRVSEVMAFARNDYVAVQDAKGRPAFELLTALRSGRLMEEPPSMMWNTRYGMMGGYGAGMMGGGMMGGGMMGGWGNPSWGGTGHLVSTTKAAVTVANRWLELARLGERAEQDAQAFPGYYTTDTTRNGKTVGMVSVNAKTGAVWYHGWHGRFLAERGF